jgi:hypothetical protein
MKLILALFNQPVSHSWAPLEILNHISGLFPQVLTDSENVSGRNTF